MTPTRRIDSEVRRPDGRTDDRRRAAMLRISRLVPLALLALVPIGADAQTFRAAPLLAEDGVVAVTRDVAREAVGRDLFGSPWATAVVGRVDVYDRFPYLESRWFQVVSDPEWNRLLLGELDGDLSAHDGRADALGSLDSPRGLAVDENGRIWVADSGNHRVVVYDTVTEYGTIRLVPVHEIAGLHRPWDVAYSDGGTPWSREDDRLYVADTGANRVVAYALDGTAPRLVGEIGELGSGAGAFGGPTAIATGRANGVHTTDVYVADAHGGRIVHLVDTGESLEWGLAAHHDTGLVTSLDTDHWGSVYAAAPRQGVVRKLTAGLVPIASLTDGIVRPRAFHVPFVTRTDHRDGTTSRQGRGAGLLVEEWTGSSGLSLVELGAEVVDLSVSPEGGLAADFVLTDRAAVSGEIADAVTGRVAARIDLGEMSPGRNVVPLDAGTIGSPLASGDWVLRLESRSLYEGGAVTREQTGFTWSGGPALALPTVATLVGSAPNPFRTSTQIEFAIPTGPALEWSLTVHDVTGRRVAELGSGHAASGLHAVTWNGRDGGGHVVAAGIYLYRLDVEGDITTRKAVHLR